MLSERGIARGVHRRLRREGIYVHRSLTRLIVRYALLTVISRFRPERMDFLDRYVAGEEERTIDSWERVSRALEGRYTGEAMRQREVAHWTRVRRFQPSDYFRSDELAAMLELRTRLAAEEDAAGVSAIDKAIRILRR